MSVLPTTRLQHVRYDLAQPQLPDIGQSHITATETYVMSVGVALIPC